MDYENYEVEDDHSTCVYIETGKGVGHSSTTAPFLEVESSPSSDFVVVSEPSKLCCDAVVQDQELGVAVEAMVEQITCESAERTPELGDVTKHHSHPAPRVAWIAASDQFASPSATEEAALEDREDSNDNLFEMGRQDSQTVEDGDGLTGSEDADTSSHSSNDQKSQSSCLLPELDMEEQKAIVAEDRWRGHAMWCEKHQEATKLTHPQRKIALRILVSEAYRREFDYVYKNGGSMEDLAAVRRRWSDINREVMSDMQWRDNSPTVLRKLSAMAVFISGETCHVYGENPEGRYRRAEHQWYLLKDLEGRGVLFTPPPPTHSARNLVQEA